MGNNDINYSNLAYVQRFERPNVQGDLILDYLSRPSEIVALIDLADKIAAIAEPGLLRELSKSSV